MAGKRRFEAAEETRKAATIRVDMATRVPDEVSSSMIPKNALKIMSLDDEVERAQVLKTEVDDLKSLTAELVAMRERANVEGRIKNLELIKKIDTFLTNMMDLLTKDKMTDQMEKAMMKALEKGDIKQVKELMVAIGIALDKKNNMIEGSGFTDGNKRGVKIAVNFQNNGSAQVGVQVD